jgi:aldehyde dehydrogenase (NAD+)
MPLVAALAAGNCVVLKPSQKTAHVAEAAARLVRATFPEDEVAIFTGGHEVSDALLELPFDHVLFTGSTSVGKKIMASAAQHLATVTLELGGKSPVLVDRSADLEAAATRVLWGKCLNAGQTCISPDYVLADAAVADHFIEAAGAVVERFYGATREARMASPDFARLIDDHAFARVTSLVERSLAMGARAAVGGFTDRATRFIEPTVLTGVTAEMPIMGDEIFGPVLPVLRVASMEEATAFVRARNKPLALYLFARDPAVIEHVLSHTTSGGSVVNDVFLHVANPYLPFGGVGASGQGHYHGEHGFRTFSHARAVVERGRTAAVPIFYPPYEGTRAKWAKRLLAALE